MASGQGADAAVNTCFTPGCGRDTTASRVEICETCWKQLAPEEQAAVWMAVQAPLWPAGTVARDVNPGAGPNDGWLWAAMELTVTVRACARSAWKRRQRDLAKKRMRAGRSWMHR